MPLWRKIFFWSLLTVYLTGCPLLILYALGITGHAQRRPVTATGMIQIATRPAKARVYLNNKPLCKQTPCLIRNLVPGDYRVVIRHDDYQTWARTIAVKAQQAVSIDPLLLIPRAWPIQETGQRFTDLIPLPWPGGFLLKQGPSLKDLLICRTTSPAPTGRSAFSLSEDAIRPALPADVANPDDRILKIYSRPNSPHVVLKTKGRSGYGYRWLNAFQNPPEPQDISDLIPDDPEDLLWSSDQPQRIYLTHHGAVDRIDVTNGQTAHRLIKGLRAVTLHEDTLYGLTSDNRLETYSAQGQPGQRLSSDGALGERLLDAGKHIRMQIIGPRLFAFFTADGKLLLNQLPYEFIKQDALGVDYDPSHRRLLFWTAKTLGYIDLSRSSRDLGAEQTPPVIWLGIRGRDIEQARWVNNGNNIVYTETTAVFMTATQTFGAPQGHLISPIRRHSQVDYQPDTGTLFFLRPRGELCYVQIGPPQTAPGLPKFIGGLLPE